MDALLIANALNYKGEFANESTYDVNRDGWVTGLDFALVKLELDGDAGDGSGGGGYALNFDGAEGEGSESGSGGGSGGGEASVSIAAVDADKVEGEPLDGASLTFRVTLTGSVPGGFDIGWSIYDILTTSSNTAYPDFFGQTASSIHFNGTDGEQHDIAIAVLGDSVVEIDETFQVELGELTNVPEGFDLAVGAGSALGNIRNDDSAEVRISNPGLAIEGGNATLYPYHAFTLSLSAPVQDYGSNAVIASYSIVDVDTTPGDYSDTHDGTITLSSSGGYIEQGLLQIDVVADHVAEREFEEYYVQVDSVNATGMQVALSSTYYLGDATIQNVDVAHVNIETSYDQSGLADTAFVPEETTSVTITVTLSLHVDAEVDVHLATAAGSPAATAGLDYTALAGAAGDVTFEPGQQSRTVPLALWPDAIVEGHEWLRAEVDSVTADGRMVDVGGDGHRDIKIVEDDRATLSIDSVEVNEPTSGFTDAVFTLTLSRVLSVPVTVTASTRDETAIAGTNQDYLAHTGNITIPAGSLTGTFSVRVYHDDAPNEGDHYFFVDLSNLSAGLLTDGDDPALTFGEDDVGECMIHE